MSHDPLCTIEYNPLLNECRTCELIDRVREDEHAIALADAKARESNGITWAQSRAAALRDAVEAVKAYVDETHNCVREYGTGACLTQNGDRCDITSALRVAVQKIEALGGEQ